MLADCHNDFKINTISIYESQLRFLIGGKKRHYNKQLSLSSNNSFSKYHELRVKREQKKERALEYCLKYIVMCIGLLRKLCEKSALVCFINDASQFSC